MSGTPANPPAATPAPPDAAVATPAPEKPGLGRKWTFGILILCFLFVLMPYLFWQQTWFGAPLSDAEIEANLADAEHPRKTQHALAQIADAMIRGDAAAKRWAPQVAQLATHKVDEIRTTAAWVMGQDNKAPEFRAALLGMLRDANPMVRRNAALALVRFGDASGHDEILAMLRPYSMTTPYGGTLDQRLKPGDAVNPGTLLGRVNTGKEEKELRSQVPGTVTRWLVAESDTVQEGQPIVEISPEPSVAWEALRALVIIGRTEDESAILPFATPTRDRPEQIATQARETLQAIQKRAAARPTPQP